MIKYRNENLKKITDRNKRNFYTNFYLKGGTDSSQSKIMPEVALILFAFYDAGRNFAPRKIRSRTEGFNTIY